eukprot:8586279-Ditylum_brightwellii.AAC.2
MSLNSEKIPHLLSVFDSIHQKGNTIYYRMEDGETYTIEQKKGIAQGCPGSTVLSTLTLGEVLIEHHQEYHQHRGLHPTQDHNNDKYDKSITFVDDKNMLVPLKDVLWLFQTIACLGCKYGCYPKTSKTKLS